MYSNLVRATGLAAQGRLSSSEIGWSQGAQQMEGGPEKLGMKAGVLLGTELSQWEMV